MFPVSFGSDNHSGVHPEVWKALLKADEGFAPAYGEDPLTLEVLNKIESLFGGDCQACFVMTGTGANVVAIQNLVKSFNAIFCAQTAHINVDECGAVQKFTQARLQVIPTTNGKLTPELIGPYLLNNRDQHHSQGKVVSIAQSTEYGTLYSIEELKVLADYTHQQDMLLQIDGARLANAAAALDCSLKDITKEVGADIVSFGGTKNGLLFGEALISFRPELTSDIRFYRKQCTQLFSKMRYISAQFDAYLKDALWKKNANQANAMATLFSESLRNIPEVEIVQPVQVNSLFVKMPKKSIEELRDKYHFYIWDEAKNVVRLMCSFNTTEKSIEEFISDLKSSLVR
ncbi:MAG TPA: aminotransferase class V-fold PLP-dependent enzyme [Candidatus Syntrophosphaera thermopropionivorans]|nr:aminotransferase class V-fold PLP-dependent enzyme [Candidatus Syntrophosphaera thermopropionivorans]